MGENLHSHAEDLERIEESDFWSKVKVKLILKLVEGKTVLDVGCGSGLLSKNLLNRGYKVTVIDSDWKAIEIAKKKGITGFVADINDWQTDLKFDCIILGDVLEHIQVEDAKILLSKMKRSNVIIGVPFDSPQGVHFDNTFEIHLQEDLTFINFFERFEGYKPFCLRFD